MKATQQERRVNTDVTRQGGNLFEGYFGSFLFHCDHRVTIEGLQTNRVVSMQPSDEVAERHRTWRRIPKSIGPINAHTLLEVLDITSVGLLCGLTIGVPLSGGRLSLVPARNQAGSSSAVVANNLSLKVAVCHPHAISVVPPAVDATHSVVIRGASIANARVSVIAQILEEVGRTLQLLGNLIGKG